jgi:hypothetical protein
LFATNQAGFFWSKDMSDWKFVYGSFQRNQQMTIMCSSSLGCKRHLILCRFYLEKIIQSGKPMTQNQVNGCAMLIKQCRQHGILPFFKTMIKKYICTMAQAENCRLLGRSRL